MTTYALITPQGAIDRQATGIDPTVATKPGWKWLPVDDAPPPAVSGVERLAADYAVGTAKVTRQWTITRRSPEEQKSAVKEEAQRRIIVLTGTSDLTQCMIKQSNANMRANELNDKRISGGTLTAEEETEAAALRTLAAAIKVIRTRSNAIEALEPIPLDYTADSYWTEA